MPQFAAVYSIVCTTIYFSSRIRHQISVEMVKKSRGKKGGVQQFSVRKHRVLARPDVTKSGTSVESKDYDKLISRWAEITWSYVSIVCTKLKLVPFLFSSESGRWIACSRWKAAVHYSLVILIFAVTTRNLIVTVSSIADNGLDFKSIISISFFLLSFTSFAAGILGSSYTRKEMVDLMNGWATHLEWIQEATGRSQSIFGSTSDNIKMIGAVWLFHLICFDFTVVTIVFANIPTTFFGFVQSLGFDPATSFIPAALAWRVIFAPLELAILITPTWIITYNISCTTLSLGLVRMYCRAMRYAAIQFYSITTILQAFSN